MYEVHWIHGKEDKHHGTFETLEKAQDSVRAWWEKNNFKPYYVRQWTRDNIIIWDYGSHTMFYHFIKVD